MSLARPGRWCRAAAAVLVLVGALLVCGPGSGAAYGSGAAHGSGAAYGSGVAVTPGVAAAGTIAPARTPGCDPLDDERGGLTPAVPPRPGTPGELLPAPHVTRVTTGAWGADGTAPDVTPERGPPLLAAPSPLDLSILRV
ncbi:hypothetical protein [Streptomyces ficellus]|uniref:Uncharacterized protein n=1 Tax=Streptomyces ficellus TaxID=1977088 RepID=A0A6I6FLF1_9ACTN|nr:hypothetical protein [Streptomyces ficellus]QGV79769.1 hypothetical protein EIZ62_17145 [Streptomyces ficellus]